MLIRYLPKDERSYFLLKKSGDQKDTQLFLLGQMHEG